MWKNFEGMKNCLDANILILLQRIIHRLEKSPLEFMEAFVDLLAAPERKRDNELLQDLLLQVWFLVKHPDIFASSLHSTINTDPQHFNTLPTRYDDLIQVVCAMIEAEIFRYLGPISQDQLHKKALHYFWGGLTLHIKLSLPLQPYWGPPIFSNGHVNIGGGKSFPCEPPLSESQIFELLSRLGSSFVTEYASSYFEREELRILTLRIAKEFLQFLVQERTLNRYVDKFSMRLSAQFHFACTHLVENARGQNKNLFSSSSLDSVVVQIITEACSILHLQPHLIISQLPINSESTTNRSITSSQRVGSEIGELENKRDSETTISALHNADSLLTPPNAFLTEKLWEDIWRVQQRQINAGIQTIYVPQYLQYIDLEDASQKQITIDELTNASMKRLVLTAPPGGGKTRLQQELILRVRASPIYHIGINLKTYISSGLQSFHQFAALELLKLLEQPFGTLIRLAEDLLMLDLEHKIWWHIDGWDDVAMLEHRAISSAIALLSRYTLSTSSPSYTVEQLKGNNESPNGFINIQPFAPEQIHEFINLNSAKHGTRIQHRVSQLPGLARLPSGLEFISKFSENETFVETLFGYINRNLQSIGEPTIDRANLVFSSPKEFESASESFIAAYLVAKAIVGHAIASKPLSVIKLDEILPYMGATSREENHKLATHRLEQGVRAKFWMRNPENQTFQFIVPEVGWLLFAIALFTSVVSRRWLDYALGQYQQDPCNPLYQMMLTLAMWHEEELLLRASTRNEREPWFPQQQPS